MMRAVGQNENFLLTLISSSLFSVLLTLVILVYIKALLSYYQEYILTMTMFQNSVILEHWHILL